MLYTLFIIFIICITIQCGYFILHIIGLLKLKHVEKEHSEPVSIIVAAKNEYQNLQKLLPTLLEQSHADFEIIIVDDNSIDDTQDFLKEQSAKYPQLKVVTVEHTPEHVNSKKYALTLGIKAAKNDLLVLTDADCVPKSNEWLNHMTKPAKDKDFVLGFSDYEKQPGLLNYFIRFETLFTAMQYFSIAKLFRPYMGVGRNLAYRKSLFLTNKGFNGYMNVMGGDDDLFVNKHATQANSSLVFEANSQTVSIPKTKLKSFLRQKTRHLNAGKHYKMSDKIILSAFSLSYLLSWLLLPVLFIYYNELYLVISSFLLRVLLFYVAIIISTKKLNLTFNVWGLLFLDILYVIYYCYTGVVALFTKRVTWS
ncbi:MAG: glycosyltransferase [Fulvivirga sp.]